MTWTLTIIEPVGNGTTDPPTGVINDIVDGTIETLTATASVGWTFFGWIADGFYSGGTNPITFPMTTNHIIYAIFFELPPTHGPAITDDIQDSEGYSMIGHTTSRSVMTSSTNFSILLAGIGLKTNGVVPTILTASSYGTGNCDLPFDVPEANTQVIFVVMAGYYGLSTVYEQYHNEYTEIIPITTGGDNYESVYIAFGTLSAGPHDVSAVGNNPDTGISIAVYLFPPNSIISYTSDVSIEDLGMWTQLTLDAGYNYYIFGAADGEEALDGIFEITPTQRFGGGGANIIAPEPRIDQRTDENLKALREAKKRIAEEMTKKFQSEQK
jgi:hypothetical protein